MLDASVCQYNRIAKKVMRELDVPVNDLYTSLSEPGNPPGLQDLIGSDGVHLQSEAKQRIGKVVADFIASNLPSCQQ